MATRWIMDDYEALRALCDALEVSDVVEFEGSHCEPVKQGQGQFSSVYVHFDTAKGDPAGVDCIADFDERDEAEAFAKELGERWEVEVNSY